MEDPGGFNLPKLGVQAFDWMVYFPDCFNGFTSLVPHWFTSNLSQSVFQVHNLEVNDDHKPHVLDLTPTCGKRSIDEVVGHGHVDNLNIVSFSSKRFYVNNN